MQAFIRANEIDVARLRRADGFDPTMP